MGVLNLFSKARRSALVRLPSGSFTMDRDGRVITSTLPQSFPEDDMLEIGQRVLSFFRAAQHAQMPMAELIVYYSVLKLTARELRGGAIIFLAPQNFSQS